MKSRDRPSRNVVRRKSHKWLSLLTDDSSTGDRSFDIGFWSSVTDDVRFAAAWELVELAWKTKGRDRRELRFSRSFAMLKFL